MVKKFTVYNDINKKRSIYSKFDVFFVFVINHVRTSARFARPRGSSIRAVAEEPFAIAQRDTASTAN